MQPTKGDTLFPRETRFFHCEPKDSFEEWLVRLIASRGGSDKKSYYKRRLITSIDICQANQNHGFVEDSSRISDHELAMYVSDRLRGAGMHGDAIDILIKTLSTSSSRDVILERIGYIVNQITRSIICGNPSSCIYSNDKLDQWASRLLHEFNGKNVSSLALGISSHLLALHDPYASRYLLNEIVRSSFVDKSQDQSRPSSILLLPGPGKTGTTSIFNYILDRFALTAYEGKEIDYWDVYIKHGLSVEWYLNHFFIDGDPNTIERSVVECSPSSFGCIHSITSELTSIRDRLPLFCMLTLRDPVSRAISMLAHEHSTSSTDGDLISNIRLAINQSMNGENMCETVFYHSRYEIFATKWVEILGSTRCISLFIENISEAVIDKVMSRWGYRTVSPSCLSRINTSKASSELYRELQEDKKLMAYIEAYFEPTYEWMKLEEARMAEVLF